MSRGNITTTTTTSTNRSGNNSSIELSEHEIKRIVSDNVSKYLDEKLTSKETQSLINKQVAEQVNDDLKSFKDTLATDKASLISVFGLFASIVSFLLVQVQVFKYICSVEKIIGLSIIMISSLLFLNLSLHDIACKWINKEIKINYFLYIVVLIFLFIGAVLSFYGNEAVCTAEKTNNLNQIEMPMKYNPTWHMKSYY